MNRHLDSTVDVLRAAPGVKLVALLGPEHGTYGGVLAGEGAFRKARWKYLVY